MKKIKKVTVLILVIAVIASMALVMSASAIDHELSKRAIQHCELGYSMTQVTYGSWYAPTTQICQHGIFGRVDYFNYRNVSTRYYCTGCPYNNILTSTEGPVLSCGAPR